MEQSPTSARKVSLNVSSPPVNEGKSQQGTETLTSPRKRSKTHLQKIKDFITGKKEGEDKLSATTTTTSSIVSPRGSEQTTELPEEPEIDRQFQEVVREMGIKDEKKLAQLHANFKTPEQKWNMIVMMRKAEKTQEPVEFYIEKLKKREEITSEFLQSLVVQLRTQRLTWLESFLKQFGLEFLLSILQSCLHHREESVQSHCVLCFNAILNSEVGVKSVLKTPEILRVMVLTLNDCHTKTKSIILVLLAVLCHHSEDAFVLILDAFSHYKVMLRESVRFHHLVNDLFNTGSDADMKVNCMILINALLTSSNSNIIRKGIQQEFFQLNLLEKVKAIDIQNKDFHTQVNIFEEEMSLEIESFQNLTNVAEISQVINGQLLSDGQADFKQILNDILLIINITSEDATKAENMSILKRVVSSLAKSIEHDGRIKDLSQNIYDENIKNIVSEEAKILISFIGSNQKETNYQFKFLSSLYESIQTIKGIANNPHSVQNGSDIPPQSTAQGIKQTLNAQTASTLGSEQHKQSDLSSSPRPPPPPPPAPSSDSLPPPPPPPPINTGKTNGVAPPPPPPVNGALAGPLLPKLPEYNPKVNTKNFHCDVINKSKISKTVFLKKGISEGTHKIKLNEDELQSLFQSSTTSPAEKNSVPVIGLGIQQQIQCIIDPKRSNIVGIQLASIRIPFDALRTAIVSMDEKVITPQRMNILKNIAPTEEELDLVTSYSGDVKNLGDCEKFFLSVKDIPMLKERLAAWTFKSKFNSDTSTLIPELKTIIKACAELQSNPKFLDFLSVVLAMSNFLNAKGRLKNTYGFKLSSLNKLKDTKSQDGKTNLLQYIARYVDSNRKDILHFYEEFKALNEAEKVSIVQIKETHSNLKSQLQLLTKTLEYYKSLSNLSPQDQFINHMDQFSIEAHKKVNQIGEEIKKALDALDDLSDAFAEDKNTMKSSPENFFSNISTFISSYSATVRQQSSTDKKALSGKLEKTGPHPPISIIDSAKSGKLKPETTLLKSGEEGLISSIERSLRDGSGFRNRRSVRLTRQSLKLHEQKSK